MKTIILIIIFLLCPSSHNSKDNKEQLRQTLSTLVNRIDTIITKEFALTIEGIKGQFQYHLKVNDWEKPVSWQIKIFKDDHIAFSKSQLDTTIDEFFHDIEYVSDCSNYLECKKLWYLEKITRINLDTLKVNDRRRNYFIKVSKEMAKHFPEYYKKTNSPADSVITSFWVENSKQDIILFTLAFAPEGRGTPFLTYYKSKEIIIPIYAP